LVRQRHMKYFFNKGMYHLKYLVRQRHMKYFFNKGMYHF